MADDKPAMSQDNFKASGSAYGEIAADFSTDAGALAYANHLLDDLVDAMRVSLEKQVTGWPIDADRELNTHEALRHLLRNISLAHAGHVEADYDNPTLTKMGGMNRIQFQLQSPDCNYHTALLHGDHRYRLKGYRGTAAVLQTTVFNGHSCDFVDGWRMISNANNHITPQYAPGNEIDVVLSREKPADLGDAVWLELPPDRCELHIRQYYADWYSEEPASLMLINDDQHFPSANLTRASAEQRWKRLPDLIRVHANYYRAGVQAHLDADPNEIAEFKVPGAFEGTNYYYGHFRCREDEAVVIEIDRPDAAYWNVELTQMQWEPGDWWSRLVCYNMNQVVPDADGKVRWVASWNDPGLANWFDVSGRELHLIGFRFFRANSTPGNPRLKTVKLVELDSHVAGMATMGADERQALMRRRLESVYRRRFGDF